MPAASRPTQPKAKHARVLVVTCEHGGNKVPPPYQQLAAEADLAAALATHRGYDLGALCIGRVLEARLQAPFFPAEVSRLLIDLNRSLHHPDLISEFFKTKLSAHERTTLIEQHYRPHRDAVTAHLQAEVEAGHQVIHIAVHSFTPILAGVTRRAECGLLYDPSRRSEREFCVRWAQELQLVFPHWRIRKNYPYQGKADGFSTHLRTLFPVASYVGIELEINHKLLLSTEAAEELGAGVALSLQAALQTT